MSLADRLGGEEELVVRVGLDDASLAERGGGVRGGSVGGLGGHLAALGLTETDGCKGVRNVIDILFWRKTHCPRCESILHVLAKYSDVQHARKARV